MQVLSCFMHSDKAANTGGEARKQGEWPTRMTGCNYQWTMLVHRLPLNTFTVQQCNSQLLMWLQMWQVNILSMDDSLSMFLLLYSEEGFFWKHLVWMAALPRGQKEQFYIKGLLVGCWECHCWMTLNDRNTVGIKGCKWWDGTSVLTDSITQWCRPLNHQFVHLFLALCFLFLSHPCTLSFS